MKIWVLLSVENNYDQPPANLVAWWVKEPDFLELANVIGVEVDIKKGNAEIGKILNGEESRIDNTDYRLECIEEGEYK